jgi:hypothetical protein
MILFIILKQFIILGFFYKYFQNNNTVANTKMKDKVKTLLFISKLLAMLQLLVSQQ